MYKIFISEDAHYLINKFIIYYRSKFLDLYSDTWIEDESLIRNNYIKASKIFKNNIYSNINIILKEKSILGKIPKENSIYIVTFTVGNFRIFIHYKESISLKERYIEDIEFSRK